MIDRIFWAGMTLAVEEQDVLEHLAFNLVGNDLVLHQIDGYVNCPDESAKITGNQRWDVEFCNEIKPEPKKKAKRR